MFGSKKNTTKNTENNLANNAKSSALNTLVKNTIVEGNIRTKSDIRIDGALKGNLDCSGKAIIGAEGSVEGDITCKSAVIEGQFTGKLIVSEILTLKETANIHGEANYDKLVVHQGAVINATLKRRNIESTKKAHKQNVSTSKQEKVEV